MIMQIVQCAINSSRKKSKTPEIISRMTCSLKSAIFTPQIVYIVQCDITNNTNSPLYRMCHATCSSQSASHVTNSLYDVLQYPK